MFGFPVHVYTQTREAREFLRAQPRDNSREVTLAIVGCLYMPIIVGVVWAWLQDYSLIGYWLSIAALQVLGLFLVLSFVLVQSVVRIRRDSRSTNQHSALTRRRSGSSYEGPDETDGAEERQGEHDEDDDHTAVLEALILILIEIVGQRLEGERVLGSPPSKVILVAEGQSGVLHHV